MHAAVQGSDTDILWVSFTEEEAALALVFFSQKTRSHTIEVFSGDHGGVTAADLHQRCT